MLRKHLFSAVSCAVVLGVAERDVRAQDTSAARPDQLAEAQRIYGLAHIWHEVKLAFPFFDQVPELDWDQAFLEYIDEVRANETTLAYYRVLQRFVALLEDGHTNVYLPNDVRAEHAFDVPRVQLEALGRRAVVQNVDTALIEQVPIGSEILRVDGIPVEQYLQESVLPYVSASTPAIRWNRAIRGNRNAGIGLLVGPAGTAVRVAIRTPSGEERIIDMDRNQSAGPTHWARGIPASGAAVEFRWLEDGIAYLALNRFSDPNSVTGFASFKEELLEADGILLDLRRNGGGSDLNATAILSHFTNQPLVGSASRIRVHDALYRAYGSFGEAALRRALPSDSAALVANSLAHYRGDAWRTTPPDTIIPPPGAKIDAPVVVLIGPDVATAAENFLVYMPNTERFTTVGRTTIGSTGQPMYFDLPGGGRARVVSRAAMLPEGGTWVGVGIQPDVRVEPSVDDIIAGRDAVLERGLTVLRDRMPR